MQAIFNFFFSIFQLKSSTLEPRENLKCSSLVIDFLEKMAKTGKRFGPKKILQDKEKINKYVDSGRLPENETFGFFDRDGEISILNIEQMESDFFELQDRLARDIQIEQHLKSWSLRTKIKKIIKIKKKFIFFLKILFKFNQTNKKFNIFFNIKRKKNLFIKIQIINYI